MTALSSMASGKDSTMDSGKDTRMTTIAAVNTINAGLLALMRHSGLPHRYKMIGRNLMVWRYMLRS